MWTIHALDDKAELEASRRTPRSGWKRSGAFTVTSRLDGATLDTYTHDPNDRDTVHFGYRDSISQPRFVVNGDYVGRMDAQPIATVGAVLLGRVDHGRDPRAAAEHYRTTFPGVSWQMPEANLGHTTVELGRERLLQRVPGARAGRARVRGVPRDQRRARSTKSWTGAATGEPPAAGEPVWDKERVAAKLMGRWRNGVPLSLSHWTPGHPGRERFLGPGLPEPMDPAYLNDFDYIDEEADLDDFDGTYCPLGSHIRRTNPRGSQIVQRSANFTAAARAARHAVRAALRPRPAPTTATGGACSAASCAQASSPSTRRSCTTGPTSGCRTRASPAPTIRSSAPTAPRPAGSRSRSTAPTPSSSPGSPGSPRRSARSTCSAPRSAPFASWPTCRPSATR